MSDQLRLPSSDSYDQPGFWTGTFCDACPASSLCGARRGIDACGHRSEYRADVFHPTDLPPDVVGELKFKAVQWPTIPPLGPALAILEQLRPAAARPVGIRCTPAIQPATWSDPQANANAYAVLITSDTELERIWDRSHHLARDLARWGVPLVIGPGYSTWWDDPPSESLVSMARSAEFARVLAGHLPTVPCVVWRNRYDLQRWARWLASTDCPAVAVDLQTHHTDPVWTWGLNGLSRLAGQLSSPLPRLVANGPSTLERVGDVASAWPGALTIASQNPWQKAQQGQALDNSLDAHRAPEFSLDELLTLNMRVFEDAMNSALQPAAARRRSAQ